MIAASRSTNLSTSSKLTRVLAAVSLAVGLCACNCGKPPPSEPDRELGAACDEDAQCKSGLCDGVCKQKCSAGCMATEVCIAVGVNRFACAPEKEGLCQACEDDSQCAYPGDRCMTVAGQKRCGRDCSFDGKCPTGYTCGIGMGPSGDEIPAQCLPVSGTCDCTPQSSGQTVPCEQVNAFGRCMGVKTCAESMFSECVGPVASAEVCNGLDDDCDGMSDEGLGVVSCGKGECARTVAACSDAGVPTSCVPGDPIAETCDDKDNDCNDIVDDGTDKQNDPMNCGGCNVVCNAPRGTSRCDAGTCEVATCQAGYANCNGTYSDGCEADLITSNSNCGMCGRVCNLPGTNGMCVAGNCQGSCLPGFVDLDGNPANGCEYTCTATSTGDLPDLGFVDSNCDGIDGEAANAIFVATTGNDANPGTRAQPKRTVQAGLVAAQSGGKRDVYVAAGTYTEQVTVPANKGLYGGYASPAWSRAVANTVTVSGVALPLTMPGSNGAIVQLMTFIGTNAGGNGQSAYGAWITNASGVSLERVTIRSGNGTGGTVGTNGTTGTSGGTGDLGAPGTEDSDTTCASGSMPLPGAGGANASCGRAGGAGGNPSRSSTGGNSGSMGFGGTAPGAGVPYGRGDTTPTGIYVGSDGAPGAPGTHGTSGAGYGSVNASGYVLALATVGTTGGHGNGGGGGGGGGGGTNNCDSWGGAGAGGGAGGCGGTFGFPAMSGGGSFAIFLFNANVNAIDCTLQTGDGGNGGRGGIGGNPGQGGAGGQTASGAGNNYGGSSEQDDGSNGGRGGRGGNGGRGGDGGGGGGGPSIAVLRGGISTWTASNATYVLGQGGAGGASAGGAGATGLRMNAYP